MRGKVASEKESEREGFRVFLEVLRGFQRFSEVVRVFLDVFRVFLEVFRVFLEVFRGPLRDPLRGRFPSQRLSVLLPLIVLPLELSPKINRPGQAHFSWCQMSSTNVSQRSCTHSGQTSCTFRMEHCSRRKIGWCHLRKHFT